MLYRFFFTGSFYPKLQFCPCSKNNILDIRGMHVEMGHKEVGGIKPKIDDGGHVFDVCEQLELDWRFSFNPLQAADNELEARIIIREVFRRNVFPG